MVTQLSNIKLFSNRRTHRNDQGANLGESQNLIDAGLFNIQHLALERQNGLKTPVAPLLGAVVDKYSTGQSKVMSLWNLYIINVNFIGKFHYFFNPLSNIFNFTLRFSIKRF